MSSFVSAAPSIDANSVQRLEDLDNYSLLLIFDLLPDDDLFTLAELNVRFRDLIFRHYFNRKYDIKWDEETIRLRIEEYNVSLRLANYTEIAYDTKQTLGMLLMFGHLFPRLDIEYHTRANPNVDVQKIATFIKRYCNQAAQRMVIHYNTDYYRSNVNNTANITFDNVDYVTLRVWTSPVLIQLNDTFPRMQRLTIFRDDEKLPLIGQHYSARTWK